MKRFGLFKRHIKIYIAVLITVVIIGCLGAYAAYVTYTNTKSVKVAENKYKPGVIEIAVEENLDDVDSEGSDGGGDSEGDTSDNSAGGNGEASGSDAGGSSQMTSKTLKWSETTDGSYTAKKEVKIKNLDNESQNNADAYIRVCILPRWTSSITLPDEDVANDSDGNEAVTNGSEAKETATNGSDAEGSSANASDESAGTTIEFDVAYHEGLSDFGSLTELSWGTFENNIWTPETASDTETTSSSDETTKDKNDLSAYNAYKMGDVIFKLYSSKSSSMNNDDTAGDSETAWSDDWIYNPKDGYFYYKYKVSPGTSTSTLLESVSVPDETKTAMEAAGVNLTVDIIADSIQTNSDANALEVRWGAPEVLGIYVNDDGELALFDN